MADSLPLRRQRDNNTQEEVDVSNAAPNSQRERMKDSTSSKASSTPPDSASPQPERKTRPENTRSSTDPSPSPSALLQSWFKDKDKNEWAFPRPHTSSNGSSNSRNRSPYSRSHLRSRSSGAALLSAPLMARAHSMPNPHTSRPFDGQSGRESPLRSRSPAFRNEDGPQRSPSWFETSSSATSLSGNSNGGSLGIEAIQEDSELDLTSCAPSSSQSSPLTQHSASFARSAPLNRRRPASPLHSSTSASPQPASLSFPASVIDQGVPINMSASTPSGSNSPALGPQKYNEPHPSQMLHHYASSSSFSSIPSTPTSARSRSPSISSLDTIEDAPEEEQESEAQLELERIERLKLAAERAEAGEGDESDDGGTNRRRNGSLDMPRFRGMGRSSDRKRWSICGGERRGDLDLETIWED